MDNLYTEDEIIEVSKHLKELVGKILLDDNEEFFVLKSFDVQGTDIEEFRFFKPNTTVRLFFINEIVLEGAEGSYVHKDDEMCTLDGVITLLRYHVNFTALETKLIKFTLKNNIKLNYGGLVVSKPNKSSNFKR